MGSKRKEAFLYEWTYKPDGRVYVGIHKGTAFDGYHHSSECEEMNYLFRTEGENFERKLLKEGKYNAMKNEEYKVLKLADARNNPNYFNKSNGSPASKGVDRIAVEKFYEWIIAQTPVLENAEKLIAPYTLSIQVRTDDEQGRSANIGSLIDDNKGDTIETGLRVTVLEEYWDNCPDGQTALDAVLDGNHSIKGTIMSKHGVEVPVIRIPFEMYCHFNNAEIKLLGNFLNRRSSKLDIKSNSPDDLVKMIRTNYDEENIMPESEECFEILSALNVPSRTARSLMKKAAKEIEINEINMNGKKIKDWTSGENKKKLASLIEKDIDQGQLAYSITSGSGGSVQTLLGHVMEDLHEGVTNITVYVRHPLPSYYKEWNEGDKGAMAQEMFAWCLEPRGVKVKFINLKHIQEDVKFETIDL